MSVSLSYNHSLTRFPSILSLSPSLTFTDSLSFLHFCLWPPFSQSLNHSFSLLLSLSPSLIITDSFYFPHISLSPSLTDAELLSFPHFCFCHSVFHRHWLTQFPPLLSLSTNFTFSDSLCFPHFCVFPPSLTSTDTFCFPHLCLFLPPPISLNHSVSPTYVSIFLYQIHWESLFLPLLSLSHSRTFIDLLCFTHFCLSL